MPCVAVARQAGGKRLCDSSTAAGVASAVTVTTEGTQNIIAMCFKPFHSLDN